MPESIRCSRRIHRSGCRCIEAHHVQRSRAGSETRMSVSAASHRTAEVGQYVVHRMAALTNHLPIQPNNVGTYVHFVT